MEQKEEIPQIVKTGFAVIFRNHFSFIEHFNCRQKRADLIIPLYIKIFDISVIIF